MNRNARELEKQVAELSLQLTKAEASDSSRMHDETVARLETELAESRSAVRTLLLSFFVFVSWTVLFLMPLGCVTWLCFSSQIESLQAQLATSEATSTEETQVSCREFTSVDGDACVCYLYMHSVCASSTSLK